MDEILDIAEVIRSAAKSRDLDTKKEKQKELFQLADHWNQIDEFEQLHTIVHAVGDSELIESVINLHITYTSFLDWINKSLISNLELEDTLPITKRNLNKVADFRMAAYEYYANFYQRLDRLRSGTVPEKRSSVDKKSASPIR